MWKNCMINKLGKRCSNVLCNLLLYAENMLVVVCLYVQGGLQLCCWWLQWRQNRRWCPWRCQRQSSWLHLDVWNYMHLLTFVWMGSSPVWTFVYIYAWFYEWYEHMDIAIHAVQSCESMPAQVAESTCGRWPCRMRGTWVAPRPRCLCMPHLGRTPQERTSAQTMILTNVMLSWSGRWPAATRRWRWLRQRCSLGGDSRWLRVVTISDSKCNSRW